MPFRSCPLLNIHFMLFAFLATFVPSGEAREVRNASFSNSGDMVNKKVMLTLKPSEFGTDYLFVRDLAGQKLVRWIRDGDDVHLIAPDIGAAIGGVVSVAVKLDGALRNERRPSILATFPVTAVNEDGEVQFDATKLFVDVIDGIPKIADNIEGAGTIVESLESSDGMLEVVVRNQILRSSLEKIDRDNYKSEEPLTVSSHISILRLPKSPMKARKFDRRMGFFIDQRLVEAPSYPVGISKWRLEKSEDDLPVSQPRKPIVFYLARNTPEWMKPWLKAGVESWNPAFEAAGFKNAVEVRDGALEKDFDERSMRYSVIRLSDRSGMRNTVGARGQESGGGSVDAVFDPRTGELLKTDILLPFPNDAIRTDYFALCGALDPRAQKLPLPDALFGAMLRTLAAHEAGHAFGLADGNYGEYTYPTEKLRDAEWLEVMGFSASVMNYSRCNYVAQPEDEIPVDYLLPRLGPADYHQIKWGYSQFHTSEGAGVEQAELDKIANEGFYVPWKSFRRSVYGISPQLFNDAVDSDDPVLASRLGLRNLRRAIPNLAAATGAAGGGKLLEQMYFQVISRWSNLMAHAATLIGGNVFRYENGVDQGIFTFIPASLQREAMKFLSEEAFQTPMYLINFDITRHFETSGTVNNVVNLQSGVVEDLLRLDRLNNIVEAELMAGNKDVYTLSEHISDLRKAVWSEMGNENPVVSVYRQRLQIEHISKLMDLTSSDNASSIEIRVAILQDLNDLRGEIEGAILRARDVETQTYLRLALSKI